MSTAKAFRWSFGHNITSIHSHKHTHTHAPSVIDTMLFKQLQPS